MTLLDFWPGTSRRPPSKRARRILQSNRTAFAEFERVGLVVATGAVKLAPDGVPDKVYMATGKAQDPQIDPPTIRPSASSINQQSHVFSIFEIFREHYELAGAGIGLTQDELRRESVLYDWCAEGEARKRRSDLAMKGLVEPVPLADPTRPYIWEEVRLMDPSVLGLHTGKNERPVKRGLQPAWRLTRLGVAISRLPIAERAEVVRRRPARRTGGGR